MVSWAEKDRPSGNRQTFTSGFDRAGDVISLISLLHILHKQNRYVASAYSTAFLKVFVLTIWFFPYHWTSKQVSVFLPWTWSVKYVTELKACHQEPLANSAPDGVSTKSRYFDLTHQGKSSEFAGGWRQNPYRQSPRHPRISTGQDNRWRQSSMALWQGYDNAWKTRNAWISTAEFYHFLKRRRCNAGWATKACAPNPKYPNSSSYD